MKLNIDTFTISDIDRKQAMEMRNELLRIPEGCIDGKEKYPRLYELFLILSTSLLSTSYGNKVEGIHFIREEK